MSQIKVALVHDYLREYGGAERVLEALHAMFPKAPVYVSFVDQKNLGVHADHFKGWQIRESWMTEIPFYKRFFSPLRVLAPEFFSSFDLSEFDLVISSSNAYFAKAVRVRPGALHICYCHTPARSLYGYSTMTNWRQNPVTHLFGELINHYLRVVDVKIAQKVPYFIANSVETAERIQKFYRRESIVIEPPVNVPASWQEVQKLRALAEKKYGLDYYLYVNRLAFAKHPELAVAACSKLGLPLKVVGSGKMRSELEKIAGKTVQFLGAVSDEELAVLYAGAKALLYPVEDEDFGIVPVEAMSYGLPVIAHRSGGPKETIKDGKTGIFFDDLNLTGLEAAIKKLQTTESLWSAEKIFSDTQKFAPANFAKKIHTFIESLLFS